MYYILLFIILCCLFTPRIESFESSKSHNVSNEIRGANDAGTQIFNKSNSTLTTDMGTQALLYNKLLVSPPILNYGVNTWRKSFDYGQQLYDQTAKIDKSVYPSRQTETGLFNNIEPLPSNAYL